MKNIKFILILFFAILFNISSYSQEFSLGFGLPLASTKYVELDLLSWQLQIQNNLSKNLYYYSGFYYTYGEPIKNIGYTFSTTNPFKYYSIPIGLMLRFPNSNIPNNQNFGIAFGFLLNINEYEMVETKNSKGITTELEKNTINYSLNVALDYRIPIEDDKFYLDFKLNAIGRVGFTFTMGFNYKL